MIKYIARKLAKVLVQYLPDGEERFGILEYGLGIAVYTMVSTLGLLLIGGLVFQDIESTVITIGVFYLNQTIGGGSHANTHLKCFSIMAIGLGVSLMLCKCDIPLLLNLTLFIFSVGGLFFLPVVVHHRKAYLAPRRGKFTQVARKVVVLEVIVAGALLWFDLFPAAFAYSLFLSFLSRLIAIIHINKAYK